MADIITQCADQAAVQAWFNSSPSVADGVRYIAECAPGNYSWNSSGLTGKSAINGGAFVIRGASGAKPNSPNTKSAGPYASGVAIFGTGWNETANFSATGGDSVFIFEDIAFNTLTLGQIQFGAGVLVRRCVFAISIADASYNFTSNSHSTDCLFVTGASANKSVGFAGEGWQENNTYVTFRDAPALSCQGNYSNCVFKNCVALNLSANNVADPWPVPGTSFYGGSTSNNATSFATLGQCPGSSPVFGVSPANALVDVSSFASLNARPKAGSVLLNAGALGNSDNLDYYGDTRGASPTIGAVEFTTSPAGTGVAPTVTTQPTSQTVASGSTVTFTASFAGSPTPTYQWTRNGANISGATSNSYTTPATSVSGGSANNGDLYRCVATNASGSVTTDPATLTVTTAAATAVAVSGPGMGAVGLASTDFTVSLNGTSSATVVVTPNDNGAGGTFTPSTVSIVNGAPATFKYTPSGLGAKTLSFTNNGGLGNQASLTYTSQDLTAPIMSGSITVSAVTQTGYTLSWLAASDNVAVSGYDLSVDGGSTWSQLGSVLTTNVTGRTAGSTDSVKVRARDASGNTSAALSVSVTLQAPSAPVFTSGVLKRLDGTVVNGTLSWLTFLNEASGLTVLRKGSVLVNAGVFSVSDNALVSGTLYRAVWKESTGEAGQGWANAV